jgi:transposase-like protein
MLAFRGIEVSHETIRQWALGPKGNAEDTMFNVKRFMPTSFHTSSVDFV